VSIASRLLGALPLVGPSPSITVTPVEGRSFDGIPRMPAAFGRQVGPRQRPDREGLWPASAGSTLVTWVAAKTDAAELEALLPTGFALAEPLLVVEALSLRNLPWLAGRGYEMLMVSTPVVYCADALVQRGRLELVTWEDRPDAITSGREELGWNKVYADTMTRSTGADGQTVRYHAAWDGFTFFDLEAKLSRAPGNVLASWRSGPLMHHRLLPRTERWGEVEVEQVTAARASVPPASLRGLQAGTGSMRFHAATFEQLPTQHHIVNRLAALDLGEVVDCGQVKAAVWADVSDIRVLSSTAHDFVADAPLPTNAATVGTKS
jgi:hypothetical protein